MKEELQQKSIRDFLIEDVVRIINMLDRWEDMPPGSPKPSASWFAKAKYIEKTLSSVESIEKIKDVINTGITPHIKQTTMGLLDMSHIKSVMKLLDLTKNNLIRLNSLK